VGQCAAYLLPDRDRIFGHAFVAQVRPWGSSQSWRLRVRLGSQRILSA
jgi:hypothetical protein